MAGVIMLNADGTRLPLADDSVDLVVTSPPYFNVRGDGGLGDAATLTEYLEGLWELTAECFRVLRDGGSMFVNVGDKYSSPGGTMRNATSPQSEFAAGRVGARYGDKSRYEGIPAKSLMGVPWRYAIGCVDGRLGVPAWLRAEILWSKKNAMPDPNRERVWRSHEHWFHLTPAPHCYASEDAKVPSKTPGRKPRMPGSVWEVGPNTLKVPGGVYERFGIERHDAPFPREWPERLVRGWCPPGGVVLDPCSGSGTTAMVAAELGRVGVGCDLDLRYTLLGRWRGTRQAEAQPAR